MINFPVGIILDWYFYYPLGDYVYTTFYNNKSISLHIHMRQVYNSESVYNSQSVYNCRAPGSCLSTSSAAWVVTSPILLVCRPFHHHVSPHEWEMFECCTISRILDFNNPFIHYLPEVWILQWLPSRDHTAHKLTFSFQEHTHQLMSSIHNSLSLNTTSFWLMLGFFIDSAPLRRLTLNMWNRHITASPPMPPIIIMSAPIAVCDIWPATESPELTPGVTRSLGRLVASRSVGWLTVRVGGRGGL